MADERALKKTEAPKSQQEKPFSEQEMAAPESLPLAQMGTVNLRQMQRLVGNQAVQRLLDEGRLQSVSGSQFVLTPQPSPTLQRQGDAGVVAGVPTPTTDTTTAPPPTPPSPEFERIMQVVQFHNDGDRFDIEYEPNSGRPRDQRPVSGAVRIILKLHINFRDFTREIRRQEPYNTMRFTAAQRRDFTWKDDEKEEFRRNIVPSIQDAWSGAHRLECATAGCEELTAGVQVEVRLVDDPEDAHNRVTAQKVPEGAPRFRSFVQGNESVLDRLDPTEARRFNVDTLHRSIGPFEFDSADAAPLESQIADFVRDFDAMEPRGDEFGDQFTLRVVGRASSRGSRAYNRRLANQRALNVADQIFSRTSRGSYNERDTAEGETGATEDPNFQRVDLYVTRKEEVEQMTAAHEAGHMFGLGDEYEDVEAGEETGEPGRFTGERPEHYEDAVTELGTAAADEVLVGDTENIMSVGMTVAAAHYTPFIQALELMTSLQWTIRR